MTDSEREIVRLARAAKAEAGGSGHQAGRKLADRLEAASPEVRRAALIIAAEAIFTGPMMDAIIDG